MSIYPNPVMKVGRETYVTVDDETKRLCEWSRQYDNSVPLILGRVKDGWDWETAITKPKRRYSRRNGSADESVT